MPPRQRVPEGPAPEPTVQKLRMRYTKRGRLRFTSTRDFQRALERAVRRAGVPVAFSAGFHPHPKISYANAAPTGVASEAEYVEIGLRQVCDPEAVRQALNDAMPDGLDLVQVVEGRTGALMDKLENSLWELRFEDVSVADLQSAAEAVVTGDVSVRRMTKTGEKQIGVSAAIRHHAVTADRGSDGAECAILHTVVRHTTPVVRPDDILTALRESSGFTPQRSPLATRLAQGLWDAETARVADPLAADQDDVGA